MLLQSLTKARRKAVWGPKRTLAAAFTLIIGLSASAFAEGRHERTAPHATPGVPGRAAKTYKLDAEVTRRAKGNALGMSSVIVTLVPGATLPAEFKKFARALNLGIINS